MVLHHFSVSQKNYTGNSIVIKQNVKKQMNNKLVNFHFILYFSTGELYFDEKY